MRAGNGNIGMQTLNWIVFSTLLLTIARTYSENESETSVHGFVISSVKGMTVEKSDFLKEKEYRREKSGNISKVKNIFHSRGLCIKYNFSTKHCEMS